MNYIVSWTVKHNDMADLFVDFWMPFLHDEGGTLDKAKEFYKETIDKDGSRPGWHLYTINLSQILESTDYSK